MKHSTVSRLGWSVLALLLAGQALLSQPYAGWAGRGAVVWMAGCIAFSVSVGSRKATGELVKNAVIVCLVIGGLSLLLYGFESRDEYGDIISEGFETDFNAKAGAGVRVFAGLAVGAISGILFADRQKQVKRSGD